MESVRIQQFSRERIEAYFQTTGTIPLSGLSPTLTIRRQSDNFYWGGASFTSVFTQVTMSAVDSVSQGGYYSYMFDTTGLTDNTYSIIASATSASNSPQIGELKVGGYIDNIDASVRDMSNAVGGGTVITLDGALSKQDKTLLIQAIQDEFNKIMGGLDIIKAAIDSLSSGSNPKEIELIRQDINNLANAIQIKEVDGEFSTILKEVHNA